MKTILSFMFMVVFLAGVSGIAKAEQNTYAQQTVLTYDATNSRMGVNASTPRAAIEISPTLLIAPSTVTPTATVTGTLSMNSNGKLATLTNTTTQTWTSILTPTTITFAPAN